MPCERYRDALTDAAAGEPAAPALEAHVVACAACRSELEALRRLMAAADDELSALATAEPSPALRVRIREAAAEATPVPAFRWGFAWSAAAAAVLALAAFGVWRASMAYRPAAPAVAVNAPPPTVPRAQASVLPLAPVAAVSSAPTPGSERLPSESINRAGSARRFVASRTRRAEPEVIVPRGEQEALLRYVALVHAEEASPSALLAVGQPSTDLPETDLEIAPVQIVPLDPLAEGAEAK